MSQGVASLAISGYPAAEPNSRAWAREPGMRARGVLTPNSRQTSYSEYLPASRRGRSLGGSGNKNQRPQVMAMLSEKDRAGVIGREEDARLADVLGET